MTRSLLLLLACWIASCSQLPVMEQALGEGKVGDPCAAGSPPVVCSPPAIKLADGSTLCTKGVAYCRDGVYSDCAYIQEYGLAEIDQSDEPVSVPGVDRKQSALITPPTSCDPCHPDCFKASDRPTTTDLGAGNSKDVTYDPVSGGIRLKIEVDAAERGPILGGAKCGDKKKEGIEQCDDGNLADGDGCDHVCLLEVGWFCPNVGVPCKRSECGNGVQEGLEQCDDGNKLIGDGCTFQCKREPVCLLGICIPLCGDGSKFPNEECDDGNTSDGDGCSSNCEIEDGWYCNTIISSPPATIELPIVYRDFKKATNNDFEDWNGGFIADIVEKSWGLDKKPVPTNPKKAAIKSIGSFNNWYNDVPGQNITYADTLTVSRQTDGTYAFDSTAFFPLDGRGWTAAGQETIYSGHNFSFTSEVRFWFKYDPPQTLTFRGDDDVWVFINGKLAVDIGGVHGPRAGSITLNASTALSLGGLIPGNLYEAAVFQAERHTSGSNYRLTLGGFFFGRTSCESRCGDGIVTPDEFCDDGLNNGKAGYCLADCQGRSPLYAKTASYWRDYAATGTCKIPPQRPLWGNLSYTKAATSLLGGQITFKLQGAETVAALPTAPATQITVPYASTTGTINIQSTLLAAGLRDDSPYLRVTALLTSSLDQKSTPLLQQFDVAYTCVNVE